MRVKVVRSTNANELDKLRRYRDLLARERALAAENPILARERQPHQQAVHDAFKEGFTEVWSLGGNRSGKTDEGGAQCAEILTGNSEWFDYRKHPNAMIWCGAISHSESALIQRKKIRSLLPSSAIISWPNETNTASESVLTTKDSSGRIHQCVFKATSQGRERWQSGECDFLWIDEEPDAEVWEEADMRCISREGRKLLTFTPLKGLKWRDKYDEVYVPWQRYKKAHPKEKHGPINGAVYVVTAGMADNKYTPPNRIAEIKRTYRNRPLMLRVRLYGEWLDTSEEAILDVSLLNEWHPTFQPIADWRKTVIFLDPAWSEKQKADDFVASVASRAENGGWFLRAQRGGRWPSSKRMSTVVDLCKEYQVRNPMVQNFTPDKAFADHLNDIFTRENMQAKCILYPKDQKPLGKIENAERFSEFASRGNIYVNASLKKFYEQARNFPLMDHDDWFDSGMNALMQLEEKHVDSVFADAIDNQMIESRTSSLRAFVQQDDVPESFVFDSLEVLEDME